MSRMIRMFIAVAGLALVPLLSPAGASAPGDRDAGFTAVFVRYYGSIQTGRWQEALELLHSRLKAATQVQTPDDLARRSRRTQLELIQAFEKFDHLEVAKIEVDLTSINGRISAEGGGDTLGQVIYDLVVFPKGPGSSLMYRVVMNVGLSEGLIIQLTQQSMARIDPGGIRDAV
jgi:hypothetical protein